jgi:hypothetical protein
MTKLIASLLLSALCALAADVTGTWSGNVEATRGDGSTTTESAVFRLKQDGAKVTGTGGAAEDTFEIQNGKIQGDAVTFEILAGEDRIFKFVLKVEGDKLSGTASRDRGGSADQIRAAKLSLTREK